MTTLPHLAINVLVVTSSPTPSAEADGVHSRMRFSQVWCLCNQDAGMLSSPSSAGYCIAISACKQHQFAWETVHLLWWPHGATSAPPRGSINASQPRTAALQAAGTSAQAMQGAHIPKDRLQPARRAHSARYACNTVGQSRSNCFSGTHALYSGPRSAYFTKYDVSVLDLPRPPARLSRCAKIVST